MPDVKGKASEMVDRAKGAVGKGGPPLATEVEGRVAAVREALQAFGQGDLDRFMSVFHDDVEWIAPKGDNFPGAGTLNGKEEIKEKFAGAVGRTYASFGFQPQHYLQTEDEDIVVVLGAFRGEGIQEGKLDVPATQVWEFKGNEATRLRIYADSEDFPTPISEEEEEEKQEKEREEEEGEGDEDGAKAESKGEGEGECDDQKTRGKAESRDDDAGEGDDDHKGEKTRGKAEGENDADAREGDDVHETSGKAGDSEGEGKARAGSGD